LFSKILVAIDGSESARKAFTTSIYIASISNCKIDVIHVVSCNIGGDSATSLDLVEDLKTKADLILEEHKKYALEKDVKPEFMLEIGDPAHIITEIINSKNYDLVILGTRGMNAIKELLIGSVSMKVIHHAKCPVMVVR
jgi:nucleotide-binding universal stress UspA family protein